jgi:DNA-binding MarR family transcriptional regulator
MSDPARTEETRSANGSTPRLIVSERSRLVDEIINVQRDVNHVIHGGVPKEWIEVEITMPQWKTLLVLHGLGHASMHELADALGAGVSTLSGIVDRLVEQGLVARDEDPRDRRVVIGKLTPHGEELVDRLVVALRGRLGRVLDRLTEDELRLVANGLRVLLDAATETYGADGAARDDG